MREEGEFLFSPRRKSFSLGDFFMFQALKLMFQVLKHMFQSLELVFQALEWKIPEGEKTFFLRGREKFSQAQIKVSFCPEF